MKVLVAQLCLTLCDHANCSPPGSSVHGIRQARILEWDAILFSRGFSQPRDLESTKIKTCKMGVRSLEKNSRDKNGVLSKEILNI